MGRSPISRHENVTILGAVCAIVREAYLPACRIYLAGSCSSRGWVCTVIAAITLVSAATGSCNVVWAGFDTPVEYGALGATAFNPK
jgi:hypothetical protein